MTDSTTVALESDFGHVQSADLQRRFEVAAHCLRVAMSEWDADGLHDRTAAHTIFVDNAYLATTDFEVPKERQYELFLNGVRAATEFIITSAAAGGVPRN
ncbi:MAG TPA: hypothetical protein VII84_06545 [Acidimicrobiales bacterium]